MLPPNVTLCPFALSPLPLSPLLFVTALAAGMVSFASPCVLPLVPAYLGFITGRSAAEAVVPAIAAVTAITANVPEIEFLMVPLIMRVIAAVRNLNFAGNLEEWNQMLTGKTESQHRLAGTVAKRRQQSWRFLSLGRAPASRQTLRLW